MRGNVKGVKRSNQIQEQYLDWMIRLVCEDGYGGNGSWYCLFALLHDMDFTYLMELDENRAIDGDDLRYRFAYECGYSGEDIDRLNDRPCSVLEMMVALAARCEEHIMDDPDSGNRTGKWFFDMIRSLGLSDMQDDRFDAIYARAVVSRFLRREYAASGCGGLFTLRYHNADMRRVEIWYQAMWYLDEEIYGERV